MSEQTSDQKIVVITGASSGIGRGAAIEIAARGMGVVITYNVRPEGAERTVEEIRENGGTAVALPLDISRTDTFPDFANALTRVVRTEWGADGIHALVNNAGFGGGMSFEEMTEDAFDAYYRVLLRGPYFLTQALLPLIEDGGAIVNTSSSSVRPGDTEPGYSGYAAMKGGLTTATRYLAKELAGRSIRVNSISPGPTRTRLGDNAFERFPEVIDGLAAKTAFGRIGEPADVGKVIAFLVSDDSAWITGEDILATGGYAL
ncbi:NAD(P)-dependent dehydrogenase, short-chain alcohol dehydrogenase family [Leifsonia sp. 98AMF]|uniref:SDR family NAD(P)-dependent oxidoreductase n=1 Tax=unclassified Leifsonia TaxID=2663824 RepID=UPI00087CB52A|nr:MULTISPECIES: SDR family oxidoreductase [unclassified Leifsonia]SDH21692.1 NAD(P)-dependent dehydrogenase, short-chain alcohol dehydrogenase family [Leifsonia sp. 197AMF]SDJ16869.1 NAD(P)-dependent dehydrogenase, short-chain alcohol dehydrogenase family [Leifsonia sp. 466MF]SDJ50521.1 NAD(P)-dependent dehydrogenase, short-chain alcohol dehydrogenase family [Leifsonia sp. 157MF]SDN38311.1 NAD(P)-dependent dehydrogenase, short-chain alcohol dehydrogenase family [Leifsonia sp. 509MF]SEM82868.1